MEEKRETERNNNLHESRIILSFPFHFLLLVIIFSGPRPAPRVVYLYHLSRDSGRVDRGGVDGVLVAVAMATVVVIAGDIR